MYAIIDIHGLPGSHNGEVTSGHLTRNPTFFQEANQQRSKDTVKAALAYITESPYRSAISALQVINEVGFFSCVFLLLGHLSRSGGVLMSLCNLRSASTIYYRTV